MVKSVEEAAASVGKAALFLALPVYAVVDVIRVSVSEDYVERRADLCAAGRDLPPSILGKVDVFLQCAVVTELSVGGFTFAELQEVQEEAYASGVQAGTEEFQAALMEVDIGEFFAPLPEPIVIVPEGFEGELPQASLEEFNQSALQFRLNLAQEEAAAAALQEFETRAPSLERFEASR